MARYAADDERMIASVLHELVDSGLLFRSGSGALAFYRAAKPEEIPLRRPARRSSSSLPTRNGD